MQYFNVGEQVIICSVARPQDNGDATVLDVLPPSKESTLNPHKEGQLIVGSSQYAYWLDISFTSEDRCGYFLQSALRKKYDPPEDGVTSEKFILSLDDRVYVRTSAPVEVDDE